MYIQLTYRLFGVEHQFWFELTLFSDFDLYKIGKLYASSAFYSPSLHPTVEDQVELARRISHSLSDISNQTSKGQSMYVNRKKRSVKWVHEGCGQGNRLYFICAREYISCLQNTHTHTHFDQ